MAKTLPESVELITVVKNEWLLTGEISLSEMSRMPESLIKIDDTIVKYDIQFIKSNQVLGHAEIAIESKFELICQRSLEIFEFPVKLKKTIGFIKKLEDEDKLESHVNPSWIDDGKIKPRELLEDEILLAIPEFPLKPGAKVKEHYLSNQQIEAEDELADNPFAVLKNLK